MEKSSVLYIDDEAARSFRELTKWTNLLTYLGIALLALSAILGIAMMIFLANSSIFEGIFVFIFAGFALLLYAIPIYFLYKFGRKMKEALDLEDQLAFHESIINLRKHYQFIGILTIVVLVLNILQFAVLFFMGGTSFLSSILQ